MTGRRALLVALVALVVAAGPLVACGGPDEPAPPGPASAPWPSTLAAYVDQGRLDRVGRGAFVRLVNGAEDDDASVTVTRAEVSSDRWGAVTWTGEERFVNETDLDLVLPLGRCGTGSDATVRLTYRLDDGPERVSTTTATDRYGAVGLLLERDCAQRTTEEAASVTTGRPRVVGSGRASVLELPVRLVPTGARADVAFAGFDRTVLFALAPGTAVWPGADPVPLSGAPVETVLRLVPGRCDPHALAEDKVGTLVPLHVTAPDLPAGAASYLPLPDETRAALRRFVATHCGWA
ncbi:hypothetical protein [Nocardioides litoris]|uniref:hypothetical protein n=1 Tax=Nocardioides litoris TaxID=1926648 RepID=UPI001121878C|nr:hypothetical protein [Nocardioides litoris]